MNKGNSEIFVTSLFVLILKDNNVQPIVGICMF
jgi:hypothetical protein